MIMNQNMQLIIFAVSFVSALIFAPLLPGIVNKVKAFFAGRKGVSLFQLYYDLFKLIRKERIHSTTASNWILPIAPLTVIVFSIGAMLLLPLGMSSSPLGFAGDAVLFFYLLGMGRFLTVLAALDTGSSFEGMGASREVQFSALAEGTIFALLALLALMTNSLQLTNMLSCYGLQPESWEQIVTSVLAGAAFFIILLCENCRVPFDDPETHLELTMIHEAMILDYAGPDLAAIHYGAALKLWIFGVFLTALILPGSCFGSIWGIAYTFAGCGIASVCVGITESIMARSRFLKLPQLLTGATVMVVLALLLQSYSMGGEA